MEPQPVPHSQVQLRAPFSHDTIAGDISDYEDAVLDPNDDVFERSACNSPEINSPMADFIDGLHVAV
jgi:hypothetical protein